MNLPLAAVDTISAWHLVLTSLATLVSGLIAAWIATYRAGQRNQKAENRIGALEKGVEKAAARDWVETRVDALHAVTEKAAARDWVETRVDALDAVTEKAAARDWVEGQIETERTGRERIHRELDEVKGRLKGGDEKFEKHLVSLTQLGESLKGTSAELHAYVELLSEMPTIKVCEAQRRACEHRLTALEAQALPKR